MGTLINIANIPIYIKDSDFLKNLTPIEKKLLHPFTYHGFFRRRCIKPFVVNIKIIKETQAVNKKSFAPSLVNKIKEHLSCPSGSNIIKRLGPYLKTFFYSDENQFRKFVDVLIGMGNSSRAMPGKDAFCIFNRESRTGYIFLHKRRPVETMVAHNLSILKTLFMMVTIEEDGILLHGSSVADKGWGYVFVGPGNAGKSTAAKIGEFERILSDDTTVIRRINHSYAIFSNPWWNIENAGNNIDSPYAQNPVPLKAIFFIKKAKKTCMKKMSLKETLAILRYRERQFELIRFYGTSFEIKNFYLFFLTLSSNIPTFELQIKKGPCFKYEFRSLLRRYMNQPDGLIKMPSE